MSNSPLVQYTRISPNCNSPRKHKIDTITIHCVAGQCTVQVVGEIFSRPQRQCSSNYGISPDGTIGMYCEEKNRSWCSSSPSNDHRAITIEVASDKTAPYTVRPAAYEALIKLCADICKRNGIPELKWRNDPSLIGQVDKQNMTVHRWFKNTACPGEWLMDHMGEIANRVNDILKPKVPIVNGGIYRLYNPNTGEHFYTANNSESNNLISLGWKYEGIGWYVPENSNTPVYRLYNPNAGNHHYTLNAAEKDNLVKLGWKYEGIAFYSNEEKTKPIYRLYNKNNGQHHYTASKQERDSLIKLGWKDENIGWYGK
ncbi:MAG: N-acetylmuramoyl-L-alanine amidase [Candidatus Fimenecus sp.]